MIHKGYFLKRKRQLRRELFTDGWKNINRTKIMFYEAAGAKPTKKS